MFETTHSFRLAWCLALLLPVTGCLVDADFTGDIESDVASDLGDAIEDDSAGLLASASARASLPTGPQFIVGHGDKCLTVDDDRFPYGAKVVLRTCGSVRLGQLFNVTRVGDKYEFRIMNRCLDVPGARFEKGNAMQIYGCNGTAAQRFSVVERYNDTRLQIVPAKRRTLCLEAKGGSRREDTTVQLYDCNGTISQDWQGVEAQRQGGPLPQPGVKLTSIVTYDHRIEKFTRTPALAAIDNALFESGYGWFYRRGRNGAWTEFATTGAIAGVKDALPKKLPFKPSDGYYYEFKVQARAPGRTQDSRILVEDRTRPAAPSGISITEVHDDEVRVNWRDNSNNERGFKVRWSGDRTKKVDANRSTTRIRNLNPNTRYCFRVSAYNNYGEASTAEKCVRTLEREDDGGSDGGGNGEIVKCSFPRCDSGYYPQRHIWRASCPDEGLRNATVCRPVGPNLIRVCGIGTCPQGYRETSTQHSGLCELYSPTNAKNQTTCQK